MILQQKTISKCNHIKAFFNLYHTYNSLDKIINLDQQSSRDLNCKLQSIYLNHRCIPQFS